MKIQPRYQGGRQIPQLNEKEGVPYFVFPSLEETHEVIHGFSAVGEGSAAEIFLP